MTNANCKTIKKSIVPDKTPNRTPHPIECIIVTAVFSATVRGIGGVVVFMLSSCYKIVSLH